MKAICGSILYEIFPCRIIGSFWVPAANAENIRRQRIRICRISHGVVGKETVFTIRGVIKAREVGEILARADCVAVLAARSVGHDCGDTARNRCLVESNLDVFVEVYNRVPAAELIIGIIFTIICDCTNAR